MNLFKKFPTWVAVAFSGALAITPPSMSMAQSTEAASENDAVTPFVLPSTGPFNPEDIKIENNTAILDWFRSAHADQASEAFSRWDGEDEIRPACAVCHSGEGFRDFHGLDGSERGAINHPVVPGGVVDCGTCHSAALSQVSEVTFPSGVNHPVQGVEAACMTCHQGRTAGVNVEKAVAGLDLDTPSSDLRFINPHYATAAASWLGGYGGAGFHYEGKSYSGRFFHAPPVSTCNSCHQPHSLEIAFETCQTCHQGDSPQAVRVSRQSYDGSGDTVVGLKTDIANNAALLMKLIVTYANDVAGTALIYDGSSYPYFFADANGDGIVDTKDGGSVSYASWTPRMLQAAYNWKLISSDKGNYVHNPDYTLELLYDSIEDLATALHLDMSELHLLR